MWTDFMDKNIAAALNHLACTQSAEGCWKGDYGGPQFLLPLYVFALHILELPVDDTLRSGMIQYFLCHQNKDGGWGLHIEGKSHVFTTVVIYVALRLLNVSPEHPQLIAAKAWFRSHGGPLASASWGKHMLALLGLYGHTGLIPVLPELWILPAWLPFHPSRFWCHVRMIYLPLSYLYGIEAIMPETPLIRTLRSELYDEPWESISWKKYRYCVSDTDAYVPASMLLRMVNRITPGYEYIHNKKWRALSLNVILDHIHHEDISTGYICLGPVNKLLNMLVWHFVRPDGEEVRQHRETLSQYLYHAKDGIKMNGYQSSETWDTAFAVQAIAATGYLERNAVMLQKAGQFLSAAQILTNPSQYQHYFRHPTRGGWPFSNGNQGWPTSDCTAEALSAMLILQPVMTDFLPLPRLIMAVLEILSFQNADGGWSTYEKTRGGRWLELFNASDCFSHIMIDYSWTECSASAIQALVAFQARYPKNLTDIIQNSIRRGIRFLLKRQRADGSWEGSWGICFTYGTWFATTALLAAGFSRDAQPLQHAMAFLRSKQLPDGGWGESVESCREDHYIHTESGQAVMSAWALLALIHCGQAHTDSVRRGIAFLRQRQQADGSWPSEHLAGIFNKTCGIHYDNYLKIFPLWALALYQQVMNKKSA
jgi:squalene/oxidosqualene cyclase-like protein